MEKRVFKLKTFSRWAKNILSDEHLCISAQEIINGRFEADFTATNIAQAQILGQSLQAVCTQALDKLVNEGVLKEDRHAHPEN